MVIFLEWQDTILVIGGSSVVQWMKHWPADLVAPGSIPVGRNLSNCKLGSIAHSLSLSPSHCPDTTEMLLRRTEKLSDILL